MDLAPPYLTPVYFFLRPHHTTPGKSHNEWSKLAAWVVDNNLASTNVRWMIQVGRCGGILLRLGGRVAAGVYHCMLSSIDCLLYYIYTHISV